MSSYYNPLNERLTQEQQETNATYIWGYLGNLGWSLNAVCGLLGNWESESRLNPNVYEGYVTHPSQLGRYGFGLPQWTPWLGPAGSTADDQRNYHGRNNPTFGRWCIDNGNRNIALMETQLDYQDTGLGGYKRNAAYPDIYLPFDEFKVSQESPDFLAKVYYRCYERSASGSYGNRPQNALDWWEYLYGSEPPDPPDPPVPTHRKVPVWMLFKFGRSLR